MHADRWDRMEALFQAALERDEAEQRVFLDEACADDLQMAAEVWALLEADRSAHTLLDGLALDGLTLSDAFAGPEQPVEDGLEGQRVGAYRVVRLLGRGGMGSVYLADRADGAFEQQVALKVIRQGFDTEHTLRRFRSERQILARLQHPHIARLLDGGTLPDGRPYVVLEYVDGEPIDAYCTRHQLSVDARLDLFATVCKAVLYAHQNLIIHRDLKPDNIFVTRDGQVKLLDFGIAKLLEDSAEGLTRTGGAVMTLEYASPEQVLGEPVGTASDLYSLGVVLYELLVGQRPYDVGHSAPAAARVVTHTQPERPSAVVARTTTRLDRRVRRLAGDLDMICLKALRKEPTRRYSTAAELHDDLRNHLQGRPVQARPDSLGYRLQTFVRRHRAGVTATLLTTLAVVMLTAFYTAQLRQERDRAHLETAKAEQVSAFLQDLFAVSDPTEALGDSLLARDVLDEGAARIRTDLGGQPAVQAELMQVMGNVYAQLGLFPPAESLLTAAVDGLRSVHGGAHEDLATALNDLGMVVARRGRYDEAEPLYLEAEIMLREAGASADPERALVLMNRATLESNRGAYAAADSLYQRTYILQTRHGAPPEIRAGTLDNRATLAFDLGDLHAADSLYAEALTLREAALDSLHPDVAGSLQNLATVRRYQGQFDEAEVLYRRALALRTTVFGEEHLDVAHTLNHLGRLHVNRGDPEQARPFIERALSVRLALLGAEHPETTASMGALASVFNGLGQHAEAERYYQRALQGLVATFGEVHPYVAAVTFSLGTTQRRQGQTDKAAASYRVSLEMMQQLLPAGHVDLARPLQGLGGLLAESTAPAGCEALLREAADLLVTAYGPDHGRVAAAEGDLGLCLMALQRYADAEPLLVRSHTVLRAAYGAEDARVQAAEARLLALRQAMD
ncbi:MAG: serine/threonine-protein kinase [Bacteroidota bacterium]